MSRKIAVSLFVLVIAGMLLSCQAFAETKIKYGGAERMRYEYWGNWLDMDNCQLDTRSFFRFKTSLWGQMDVDQDFTLYAKLTNEFKAYTYFGGATSSAPDKTADKKGYRFDINEVVFDNLYADMKGFMGLPVDLRLGRQDFLGTYGEGFLIMDGTPQDGSRTFYFNAAKATWHMDDTRDLDFIYINNPRDEEVLPVINRLMVPSAATPRLDKAPQLLNTTDEEAGVLYFKDKSMKDKYLEAYYIYKTEAAEGGGTGYQSQSGDLNTIGAFTKCNFSPFTIRKQAAVQFGDYGGNDRIAYGGYGFLDRDFKDAKFSPRLSAGILYLSGDKKSSDRNEGWDPLFSRWPWMSELYVLTMAGETGVLGYWTNMQIYRLELALNTTKKTKLSLNCNYLRANAQVAATSVGARFSGTSKERGWLPQIRFDYKISDNITTCLLGEYLQPGDFYTDNDPATFLRTEVQIKF
jgi:hypothetical protein